MTLAVFLVRHVLVIVFVKMVFFFFCFSVQIYRSPELSTCYLIGRGKEIIILAAIKAFFFFYFSRDLKKYNGNYIESESSVSFFQVNSSLFHFLIVSTKRGGVRNEVSGCILMLFQPCFCFFFRNISTTALGLFFVFTLMQIIFRSNFFFL